MNCDLTGLNDREISVIQSLIVLISEENILDSHPFHGSLMWKNTHVDLGECPSAVCGPDFSIKGFVKEALLMAIRH